MAEPRKQSSSAVEVVRSQRDRAKSLNDIYAQRNRIMEGSPERRGLAMRISREYVRNIELTPEYAFDSLRPEQRRTLAMEAARSRGYTTAAQANADAELTGRFGTYTNDFFNERLSGVRTPGLMARRYSRSVYARNNR